MPHTFAFAGQTQVSLLHVLIRSTEALPLGDIATHIGVTKTAARQHILALQKGGYVQIAEPDIAHKKERGRPTFAYEISREGRELFARQYALFSEKMILMMKDMLDEKSFKKQMRTLGKSLADDLMHKMPKPQRGKTPTSGTLTQLATILRELGYDAHHEIENEIIAHNCVFHQLAENCEQVCEVDLSLMQKLSGKKPIHTECMVRGGTACRFKF
jgi:predicted ArsR family transcriptional regulator